MVRVSGENTERSGIEGKMWPVGNRQTDPAGSQSPRELAMREERNVPAQGAEITDQTVGARVGAGWSAHG